MEHLDFFRETIKHTAANATGLSARQPRRVIAHQRARGREGEILALPVDTSQFSPIQNSVTGAFHFMVDYSPVDGPDEVQ